MSIRKSSEEVRDKICTAAIFALKHLSGTFLLHLVRLMGRDSCIFIYLVKVPLIKLSEIMMSMIVMVNMNSEVSKNMHKKTDISSSKKIFRITS